MRKIASFILLGILVFVSSCMYVGNEDRNGYHIEGEKRFSKIIGMDGLPIEKIQYEYYIVSKGKRSATVVGYVVGPKETVRLYVSENSSVKREQTFPVDDKMEIDMLDYVMCEIKNNKKHYDVKCVELSMKTCGVANLNISKNYWKTRRLDKKSFQQPLFNQIRDILRKFDYDVYDISHDDFYPITAREIGNYHMLSDTCSLNSMGIDAIIVLACKKVKFNKSIRYLNSVEH